MNQLGRKIYYDKTSGEVLVDTGERMGFVQETTTEQDFEVYTPLKDRVPDSVGMLQLAFGEYSQDFIESNGFKVDLTTDTPKLVFSYPDPTNPAPEPVYQKPMSVEIEELKTQLADAQTQNAGLQAQLAQTNTDMSSFMDYVIQTMGG